MEKLLQLLRKAIDDGNGNISLLRLIVGIGVFQLINGFCLISILACFIEFKNIELVKIIIMQFGVLVAALLAAKVGQSFSENK